MPEDWIDEALKELPSLCTVAEAARVLRVSLRTLQRKLATGEIRSVRSRQTGSSPNLIPRTELARYLRSLEAA